MSGGNPNKRRGTAWETAGVRYLRELLEELDAAFQDIRRVAQTGVKDVGDAHAHPFCLEFKNAAKLELAAWVEQAEREARNAGLPYGVVVAKRRGKGPRHGYVIMSMETFGRVLALIRILREDFSDTPGDREL